MRFELMTSSLPRKCSTTELHGQPVILTVLKWSGRRGSNSRPLAWKANALPTELLPLVSGGGRRIRTFEGWRRQIYSLLPLATRAPLHLSRTQALSLRLELVIGLEPTTYWLQISCSTNWATVALSFLSSISTHIISKCYTPSITLRVRFVKRVEKTSRNRMSIAYIQFFVYSIFCIYETLYIL